MFKKINEELGKIKNKKEATNPIRLPVGTPKKRESPTFVDFQETYLNWSGASVNTVLMHSHGIFHKVCRSIGPACLPPCDAESLSCGSNGNGAIPHSRESS